MRCWTITARRAEPGIETADGAVALGQSGRGRELTRVPLDRHAILDEAGRLVELPGAGALVRVPGLHGFRGTARVCPAPADPMLSADEEGPEAPCLAAGIVADGDAGNMASSRDALYHLQPGQALQVRRHGRLYGGPARIRIVCGADGAVSWIDLAEFRRAVAAENAVEDAIEAMPGAVEAVLEWAPTPSKRRHTDAPTLVAPDGTRHQFRGGEYWAAGPGDLLAQWSIPGVVEVIRDRSERAGGPRCCRLRFDVVLAPGVQVIPGTHYLDGVPEGGAMVEAAAPAAAVIPADVAEARAAGNPFAALAGLRG